MVPEESSARHEKSTKRRRLTDEQRAELVRLSVASNLSARELALRFGISQSSAYRILRRDKGLARGSQISIRKRSGAAAGGRATQWRVSFTAERIINAANIRDAVRQAEAFGHRITGISSEMGGDPQIGPK